jgi:hypothetical protein
MKRRKEAIQAFCPHCCETTTHILQWKYQRWTNKIDLLHPSYYVATCDACKELLLYVNHPPHDDCSDRFEGSVVEETILAWPEAGGSHDAVPEAVRGYYEEAVLVRKSSLNSYATNIRRALEAICADRGIDNGIPLGKRLQMLAFRDELAPRLNDMTILLKKVGNIGAHADRKVTSDEARLIDKVFKLIVDYFYNIPNEIKQLQQALAGMPASQTSESTEEPNTENISTGKVQ